MGAPGSSELYRIALDPNRKGKSLPGATDTRGSIGGSDVGANERDDQRVRDLIQMETDEFHSPLTTKGDLFGFDTADTRIPVGTNGYVLTARSSNSKGVAWEAIDADTSTLVNVDYVVDSNGSGTHTALLGASGAYEAAVTATGNKHIWVCASHVEPTLTSTTTLSPIPSGTVITVWGGGPYRPRITCNLTSDTLILKQAVAGGGTLRFQGINWHVSDGKTLDLFGPSGGIGGMRLELWNCGFTKDSTGVFRYLYTTRETGSNTPAGLIVRDCVGNATITAIFAKSSGGAGAGRFLMKDNDLTLTNIAYRLDSTDFDAFEDICIENNRLSISSYAWKLGYDVAFKFTDNIIYHTGNEKLLVLGDAGQTDVQDCMVNDNYYEGTAAGQSFLHITAGSGEFHGSSVKGNVLNGPGSGTAIIVDMACDDSVSIDNVYDGWDTDVGSGGGGGHLTVLGDHPFQLRGDVSTTNATVTTCLTLRLPDDRTTLIEVRVVARQTGGAAGTVGHAAGYILKALYSNEASAGVLIGGGTGVAQEIVGEDNAAWDATLDISGEDVRVRVTGEANKNINWRAVAICHTQN